MDGIQVEIVSTAQSPLEENRPLQSWEQEVPIPEQFFGRAIPSALVWTPERRLLFAVFRNAVESIFRYRHDPTPRGRRLFKETHDWFCLAHTQGLYSFENICAHLHLNADYIRRGLKRVYDPATVSYTPLWTARRQSHRIPSHQTEVYGRSVGQSSHRASSTGRTRSRASE